MAQPGPDGKRIRIGTQQMQTPWLTVVGEISDTQLLSPDNPATEQYYISVDQAEEVVGPLGQPTDLNGNGGYIVLRSACRPNRWRMHCAPRYVRSTRCCR